MSDNYLLQDSIFKVGAVVSVDGRLIKVKVDKMKNTSHFLYKGELLKNISVGGYVKLIKGFTKIVGKVEGEYVTEEKLAAQKQYVSDKERVNRILNISLLGFFKDGAFERGIKELPLIDTECFLLDNDEFNRVHDFVHKGDKPITIGVLALEKGQSIGIGIDSLFASHVGIFGNTGSGKSYTLAKLYRELFLLYKDNAKFRKTTHFFLLDFNGEYIGDNAIIDKQYKNIYRLTTRNNEGTKFPVTDSCINEPTFWTIFLTATEKTQTPFLERTLRSDFYSDRFRSEEDFKEILERILVSLTIHNDRNLEKGIVLNFLKEVKSCLGANVENLDTLISDYQYNLQWHTKQGSYYYLVGRAPLFANESDEFIRVVFTDKLQQLTIDTGALTELDVIRLKIVFQFYDEIAKGFANLEHLAPLIKRLDKRIDDLKKVINVVPDDFDITSEHNLTVVSLKDVNINMKKILPLLLCKQLYDEKKRHNDKDKYLSLIIDEAHNILSYSSDRESESWKDYRLETFEEIIKEGRKFGVFLTIASQRPADISPTIISQLHNYFLHRLINNNDINAIERTIAYLDKLSVESLSILPTGTCILAGLLAQVPVVVDIDAIESTYEPDNQTMKLVAKWDAQ